MGMRRIPVNCTWPCMAFSRPLYIQQDAVRYLCKALNVRYTGWEHPGISEVRNIRDDVSHPTQRQPRNGPLSFHSIVRSMMRRSAFTLHSVSVDDQSRAFRHINTAELWQKQAPGLCEILDMVITTLEERDRQHREAFMSTKTCRYRISSESELRL